MNGKSILAVIAGTISAMISGGLIYGLLLNSYMKDNMIVYPGLMKEPMEMWLIVSANLSTSILLCWIFVLTSTKTFMNGLMKGAIVGLLLSLYFDFFTIASMNLFKSNITMLVDIISTTILTMIVGGVIAMVLGFSKKSK